MNAKYITILLALFSSNVYSDDAFNICKQKILKSNPYGKNATVEKPKNIRSYKNEVILDWDGMGKLIVTTQNGESSLSVGRCIYNKNQSKITFLSIYSEVLISKYQDEVNAINISKSDYANLFAKKLGLSHAQIEWIKRYGQKSIHQEYNTNGAVSGFVKHSKKDLEHLDKLQIINLYPNNHNENLYLSVPTDISRALSKQL